MKYSLLKQGGALLLILSVAVLPACRRLNESDRDTRPLLTAPELPVEGSSLSPDHYYTPAETAQPDPQYTPEAQLAQLADRDFGGAIFMVVQEKGLENAIFPTSDELVNVYADRRNRLVQEKYNVQLASRQMSADELLAELSADAKSGVYFADLLVVSPSLLAQLQANKLIVSLDSLPFFETGSVCISAQATAEINSGWNGIYGIWGDVLRQPTRQLCLYFNRTMAEKLSCDNFYASVRSGSWTFDGLLQAVEKISDNSAAKIAYDGNAADLLFGAAELSSMSDEGKALLADSSYSAMIERFSAALLPASSEGATARDRFIAGESLFYIGTLGDLSPFSQTNDAYGLLPIPKYRAEQEVYPILTEQSKLPVLACPVNVSSAAGTGIMLSALNAASCDEINGIFLQSAEEYVRDNGSVLMLPYMIGSLHFDRKLIYG